MIALDATKPEVLFGRYLQRALVAIKILLGLGQIMSKQPSALKEKFPVRHQWAVVVLPVRRHAY